MRPDMGPEALEERLARAVARATPDLLAQAASAPVTPLEAPDGIVPEQGGRPAGSRTTLRAAMGLCACLAVALCLGLFSYFHTAAVIGIDVNPSIEISANRYDRVLGVRARNQDGTEILGDMKLVHLDLDTAVNAIIGSMVRHGYFDSEGGAVLVSVSGGSEDYNVRIQRQVAGDIESLLGGRATVLTQNVTGAANTPPPPADPTPPPAPADPPTPEPPASVPATPRPTPQPTPGPIQPPASAEPASVWERAARNGISYGKQVFIDRLRGLDPTLDEGTLAAMPIGRIASLVRQRGLDLSLVVDGYDRDDSAKENIEDFIDDLDDEDDDRDDDDRGDDDDEDDRGGAPGHRDDDDDDDEDDRDDD